MRFPSWMSLPRKLPGLFLVATLVPVIALVWLGWRLLEQDRALENQRILERLEDAADLIGAAIDRRIAGMQDRLAGPPTVFSSSDLPGDALIVRLGPGGLDAYPPARLIFGPKLAAAPQAPENIFEKGELSEYRNRDYAAAAALFRGLARSGDPLVRAGALLRLARNLRKAGRNQETLSVYQELAGLGSVPIGDDPAELVGRHAHCALLYQLGKGEDILNPGLQLYSDLQSGRWRLTRASYQYYAAEIEKWLGKRADRPSDIKERIALAGAVDNFWKSRSEFLGDTTPPRGSRSIRADDHSFLLVWNRSTEGIAALFAGPRYLASEWKDIWEGRPVALSLIDGEGHSLVAQPVANGKLQVVRPSTDTGLPWTLRVSGAGSTDATQSAARRRILIAVLAVMTLAVLACGYFTARAAAREMNVARLQSDFVSAVSHEFRTPLTSMRHLTELLEGGIVSSEERKQKFYGVLARETRRLHRLVESLLNFGRMEAGKLEYQFDELDAATLVREVAVEFQSESDGRSCSIELAIPEDYALMIRGDREALSRALWNLLDNAVKYSPAGCTVQLELAREGNCASICVRDRGMGIPAAEQKEIFKKFVRGSASRASSAKGAGIGLAMVQHIVDTHKGMVRVESRPGEGSTFTILLPAESPAADQPKGVEEKA
jgi:signal transduction histidine kinase